MLQRGLIALFGLFFSFHCSAQDFQHLQWALQETFKSNPRIQISQKSVESQQGFLLQAENLFMPSLNFSLNSGRDRFPTSKFSREDLFGTGSTLLFTESNILSYRLYATQFFKTGLSITPEFRMSNFGKDDDFFLYQTLLGEGLRTSAGSFYVHATQPLLFGRGSKAAAATLNIQKLQLNAAELEYQNDVSQQAYIVLQNYLSYLGSLYSFDINSKVLGGLETYKSQLSELAEKDVIPKADLLYVNANYSQQSAFVNQSQNSVVRARNSLAESMGLGPDRYNELKTDQAGFFVESVEIPDSATYVAYWVKKALKNRGGYQGLKKRLESGEVNLAMAERNNAPQLDLNLSVGYNGIMESAGADVYFTPFYSNIPGVSYNAGIVFSLPVGLKQARGQVRSALASKESLEQSVRQLELNIQQAVTSAYTEVVSYAEAVKQFKEAVASNAQALENEYIKLKLGTTTVVNLIQVQQNDANLRSNLNSYLGILNSSIIKFRYQTGTLVKGEGTNWSIDPAEIFSMPPLEN